MQDLPSVDLRHYISTALCCNTITLVLAYVCLFQNGKPDVEERNEFNHFPQMTRFDDWL